MDGEVRFATTMGSTSLMPRRDSMMPSRRGSMMPSRRGSMMPDDTLKSKEIANENMKGNLPLQTAVSAYRCAVLLLDLIVFMFRALIHFLRIFAKMCFPVSEKSISGQVAIVTGAGQGMGREIALELGRCGAVVVCVDIREDTNQETMRLVQQQRGLAFAYTCDVCSREEIEDLQKVVKADVGDVTILINNAGILHCRPFLQHTDTQIEDIIQTNLMGQLWMLRAFLPRMLEMDKGSVVSLCSIAGHAGAPHMVPYSASKFAVKGMMEALHQELRAERPGNDIHLMTVSPFIVDTGMIKGAYIRFPSLLNKVSANEASQLIVKNMRKGASILFIPGRYYYLHNFARLLPTEVQWLIGDFIDTGVDVHYDENMEEDLDDDTQRSEVPL